jgi:hypothetical protein
MGLPTGRARSVAQAGDAVQFDELSLDSGILSACLSYGSKCAQLLGLR